MFEIERVRDRERKIGYSLHKGTEMLVRDRERFEIEGVRDRESQLYFYEELIYVLPGNTKVFVLEKCPSYWMSLLSGFTLEPYNI